MGRHGSDIISYPEIISEQCHAEFRFTDCLMIRLWDECSYSISGADPEDKYDGNTFRRFTKSSLVAAHSHVTSPLYHYQLVCDDIIDLLCTKPPTISIRESKISDEPMA